MAIVEVAGGLISKTAQTTKTRASIWDAVNITLDLTTPIAEWRICKITKKYSPINF